MSELKATFGPWKASGRWVGTPNHKSSICECFSESDCRATTGKSTANAHLIAAAPELYEALEQARHAIISLPDDALGYGGGIGVVGGEMTDASYPILHELLNDIDAALAKARGGS